MDTRDFYANPTQICMIRKVHTLLYYFLVMNPFLPENMQECCDFEPEMHNFNAWLGYLSSLQNPFLKGVPLAHWLAYVKQVVKMCADVCGYTLTEAERDLYSYAIAIKVYPNAESYVHDTEILSAEKIRALQELAVKKDEQKWAVYIVGKAVLDVLVSEKNFRAHLFIELMEKLKPFVDEFPALEKKFDNYRIGRGIGA